MTPTERLILKGLAVLIRQHWMWGGVRASEAQAVVEEMAAALKDGEPE